MRRALRLIVLSPCWLLVAAALLACASGCPRKAADAPPPEDGQAPPPEKKDELVLPPEWNPPEALIAAAPENAWTSLDKYTVRFSPQPTRRILSRKARVYELAVAFFKGTKSESDKARAELVEIGIPTAAYLVELAGILVPKSERPVPPPDSWDIPETPEDKALELVKDIQDRFLRQGDMNDLMSYFAAATGKAIDLDERFFGAKREFRSFRVHPVPALWRVGDDLGCDMAVIAPDADTIPMYLPVLFDMNVHGEDVRWLLQSMARLGGFTAELAPEVAGEVRFRVRAETYSDAFTAIAGFAGFTVDKIPGGFRVTGPR